MRGSLSFCVCVRTRAVAKFFFSPSVSAAYERTYLRSHLLRSHGLRERREDELLDASGFNFNDCSDICSLQRELQSGMPFLSFTHDELFGNR